MLNGEMFNGVAGLCYSAIYDSSGKQIVADGETTDWMPIPGAKDHWFQVIANEPGKPPIIHTASTRWEMAQIISGYTIQSPISLEGAWMIGDPDVPGLVVDTKEFFGWK